MVARKDYGAPLRAKGWEVRFDGRQKVAGLFKIKPEPMADAPKADAKADKPKAPSKPQTAPKAKGNGKAK